MGLVEVVGDGGGPSGGRERGEVGRGHVAEVVPPVQHRGQAPVARVEDQAHPRRTQVNDVGRRGRGLDLGGAGHGYSRELGRLAAAVGRQSRRAPSAAAATNAFGGQKPAAA